MSELNLRWLAAGGFLSNLGMSFIWPLTSVYLHNDLHVSLTVIGIVLMFNSITGIIGSYAGGVMYDRGNPYHLLLIGVALSWLGLIALAIWHGWPAFPILLAAIGLFGGWNVALVNAIATSLTKVDSGRIFNTLYLFQNLGIVIGSSLVGFLYGLGVTWLFITAAVLFTGFFVLVFLKFRPVNHQTNRVTKPVNHTTGTHQGAPVANLIVIYALYIGLIFIWSMYNQWTSNVSVYMTTLGIPLTKYSLLWTLNAGGIVLIQSGMSLVHGKSSHPRIQLFIGLSMLMACFAVLIGARQYISFVLAMALLTIGEATAFPAIPAMIDRLSTPATKGRFQGLLNAAQSTGRAIGPLVGGAMIEATSYAGLFEMAVIVYLVVLVGLMITLKLTKPHIKSF